MWHLNMNFLLGLPNSSALQGSSGSKTKNLGITSTSNLKKGTSTFKSLTSFLDNWHPHHLALFRQSNKLLYYLKYDWAPDMTIHNQYEYEGMRKGRYTTATHKSHEGHEGSEVGGAEKNPLSEQSKS